MSPRGGRVRTEKQEKALDSALKKVEKAGKDPNKTIGAALRRAAQENA